MLIIISNKNGSALLIIVLLLASIILAVLGAAGIIMSGIKMSGLQEKSTTAYFAAEAGAERVLWEIRKNSFSGCSIVGEYVDFAGASCGAAIEFSLSQAKYSVYYNSIPPASLEINSVGNYLGVKRIVQIGY